MMTPATGASVALATAEVIKIVDSVAIKNIG